MQAFYSDQFVLPLPQGHRFPMAKYAMLRDALVAHLPDIQLLQEPRASDAELLRVHTPDYVRGIADGTVPPAVMREIGFPWSEAMAERARRSVGATVAAARSALRHGIGANLAGGTHHAYADKGGGFCVFNDCGVVIDTLRSQYGIQRVAYVDIDVHHGDGLYYPYESDPDLVYADIHEDGRFLYPGTGAETERGKGPGAGLKLNIPMKPGSGNAEFMAEWERVEAHLREHKPEFIVFQAGADSIAGDPLAHLQYTPETHAHAARQLCVLANEMCQGRIMGFGGGGYNRNNLALGWCGVLDAFIRGSEK